MRRAVALLLAVLLLCLSGCSPAEDAAETDGVVTITIASWMPNSIAPIAAMFNETHDDLQIELVFFFENGPGVTVQSVDASQERAYITFLSGETPDLYFMRSFDELKLRNGGLLQDWNPIMDADPDFRREDYQEHIWELLESDGELYQVCTSFTLFGTGGAKEIYGDRTGWTLEEFETFLAENEAGVGTSQERLLQLMLWYGVQYDYIDFDTKTCEFTSQAFLDWLAFFQRLPKNPQTENQITAWRVAEPRDHAFYSFDFKNDERFIDDPSYWHYPRCIGLPNEHADGPVVQVDISFALSATTEKVDACWTFVKWLLSYEMQQYMHIYADGETYGNTAYYGENAIPMHKAVWEEQLQTSLLDGTHEESPFYKQGYYVYDREASELVLEKVHPGLPQEEVDYLRRVVAEADRSITTFFHGSDITAIIEEEVLAFLAGDKTAEECAHLIQSRVSIMLAEMQ